LREAPPERGGLLPLRLAESAAAERRLLRLAEGRRLRGRPTEATEAGARRGRGAAEASARRRAAKARGLAERGRRRLAGHPAPSARHGGQVLLGLELELLVVAILFVCAACIGVLLRRKRRLDSAAEARQRWVDGVMQQVGYQLYSSEDEYREAMDAYMLEHGLSGTEESHYLDFIRYTMSEQESRDPGSPTRAIGKAAKAGFG